MSGDDQLPLEGSSNDAEATHGAPLAPYSEQRLTFDQRERGVDATTPAELPAAQVKETAVPVADNVQSQASSIDTGAEPAIVHDPPAAEPNEPTPEAAAHEPVPRVQSAPARHEAEHAPPVHQRVGVTPAAPMALYFLTNSMNLNGVLSSRLVAPRESHAKYYVDLLEQVPGWVPLLTQPPHQALIEAVTTERGAGVPVLIEFPVNVVKRAELKASVVYVPALALSQAVSIHFREERDLREHRARGYTNIHPHDVLLKVTPKLFTGGVSGEVVLKPPADPSQVGWKTIDRIRGAINGALAAAQSGEQLGVTAAILGEVTSPARVSLPDWISWREVDDHGKPEDRPAPDLAAPDHVGFRAVYEVLGEQDASDAWSPNAVLDSVASRIRAAELATESANALIRNLQRVRSIVNVEADFEPFRPTARGLVSAKALLLVLLRPELEELLAWPKDQTGADDATRVVAAVLAGRLRGLARESTLLRSLALDDLTAVWAVRVARGQGGALGKVQFSSTTLGTSLKLDGTELASRDAGLPGPGVRMTEG